MEARRESRVWERREESEGEIEISKWGEWETERKCEDSRKVEEG